MACRGGHHHWRVVVVVARAAAGAAPCGCLFGWEFCCPSSPITPPHHHGGPYPRRGGARRPELPAGGSEPSLRGLRALSRPAALLCAFSNWDSPPLWPHTTLLPCFVAIGKHPPHFSLRLEFGFWWCTWLGAPRYPSTFPDHFSRAPVGPTLPYRPRAGSRPPPVADTPPPCAPISHDWSPCRGGRGARGPPCGTHARWPHGGRHGRAVGGLPRLDGRGAGVVRPKFRGTSLSAEARRVWTADPPRLSVH